MTVYFRPLNLQHTSGIYSEFILDLDNIQLLLEKSQYETGIYSTVRKYDISELEISQHSKKQQKFITFPANIWLKLTFKSKAPNFEDDAQGKLELSKLIQISSYGKNDALTRFLTIGNYKLGYQFKCNRFLQVCGVTLHKSLAIYSKHQEGGRGLKPLKTAVFKDLDPNSFPLHENGDSSLVRQNVSRSEGRYIPINEESKYVREANHNKETVFYKGACENNNMFSFLDGDAQARKEKKFEMIQQPYL